MDEDAAFEARTSRPPTTLRRRRREDDEERPPPRKISVREPAETARAARRAAVRAAAEQMLTLRTAGLPQEVAYNTVQYVVGVDLANEAAAQLGWVARN